MIDLVPKPAGNIETEIVEGEVLLYQPQGTKATYLNPTAAVIWGLCDGARSVREIIRLIGEGYPDADDMANHVMVTLRELQESGLLVIR
jgi:Coenzyme PQQ synthesis protein D (PqqD)